MNSARILERASLGLVLSFFCLFRWLSAGESTVPKRTVCLNMIVKDESRVIARCLSSVKPLIDYWVIVDTGSTDGTQEIIKQSMQEIPGELHERPWKNFAYNRNQALELAAGKADYLLFVDADEVLEFPADFTFPLLDKDSYDSMIVLSDLLQYDRTLLIKASLDWKWCGVLHEYLDSKQARTIAKLQGIKKIARPEGARSADPQKYQKDARVLEEALEEEPDNARYVFYLAQSYRDAGDYASALKNYERRVKMGGWDEEIYYSLLQIARLQEQLEFKPEILLKSYYDAYLYRPSRAEPLYYLARYYRSVHDFAAAYLISSIGITLSMPNDRLFIEKWVYDYDLSLEYCIDAYWIGKYEECQRISKQLLAKNDLPDHVRQVVQNNLALANAKLFERYRGVLQFGLCEGFHAGPKGI